LYVVSDGKGKKKGKRKKGKGRPKTGKSIKGTVKMGGENEH